MTTSATAFALRYPVQVLLTAVALLVTVVTLVFFAADLPLVTRSIRNFIRLLTLTLVVWSFAIAFWLPPLFERLQERKA